MPGKNGTGPGGIGTGSGRRGSGKQGRGGGRMGRGLGAVGACVCPKCGKTAPHNAGIPCFEIRCPDCDIPMIRKQS